MTQTLDIGTPVKVNCYHGHIRRAITDFLHNNPFRASTEQVRLLNPLYEIEMDLSRKFASSAIRTGSLHHGKNTTKLFADEFIVLDGTQHYPEIHSPTFC